MRTQRLHPSGEREEERLCAVRHPRNDLTPPEKWQARDGRATWLSAEVDTCKGNSSQNRDVMLVFASEDFFFAGQKH